MASDDVKKQIAKDVALGIPKKEVAQLYGYEHVSNFYTLINHPDMKRLIQQERDLSRARKHRTRQTMEEHADTAAANIVSIANDTTHKDSLKANKIILDASGVTNDEEKEKESQFQINVSADVIESIEQSFMQMKLKLKDGGTTIEQHLLTGEDALPQPIDTEIARGRSQEDTQGNEE